MYSNTAIHTELEFNSVQLNECEQAFAYILT